MPATFSEPRAYKPSRACYNLKMKNREKDKTEARISNLAAFFRASSLQPRRSGRRGQSLIDLLIGIAVGAILIGGSIAILTPSFIENKQAGSIQSQAELADELATNIKAWAGGGWDNVLALATGTANTYFLNTSASPFVAVTTGPVGLQQITLGSSTYNRYFYLTDVYRDAKGNATTTASGTFYDPSTKLVTVIVVASSTTATPTTYKFYLNRDAADSFNQASWSGGSGQAAALTVASATYFAATSVSVTASGTLTLGVSQGSCSQ